MINFSRKTICLGFILSLLFVFSAYSQVVINEICPANISIIQNSNGDYDDWIELHNSGGSTVNLAGYGLTDDLSKPFRFTFPSYSLQSGKKIIVFASDSTSEVIADHWEMAINATSTWRYTVGSASIDTNWRNPSFNQNVWATGNGGIGFGDSDDGTTVSPCISVMMRKTFSIPDTSQVLKAVLMMDYDDGFVAYLNGVEIARSNLGYTGQRPLWSDLANSSHEASVYQGESPDSFYISPSVFKSLLRPTNNVLAIETHNTPLNSNDVTSTPYLFFGMKSTGLTFSAIPSWFLVPAKDYFNAKFKLTRSGETIYLVNSSGTVIDQKTYPAMSSNNSYCRKPDGSSTWCFVSSPTPDATNNSSTCYTGYANPPVFSVQGGYYNSARTLSLSNTTPGGIIRFTTNGDDPTTSSPQYISAITISTSTSVRAKVFASGYLPSEVVTNTYLIGESTHLPSFSITTDSLNLWDENTGIYTMGPNAGTTSPYFGANFWMDWPKPASIEYYDRYKNLVVRFDAEIEIFGNYSRAKPQKSIEVKLSDKFGTGSINYPLYSDKPFVDDIDNFILRNSGTDWNIIHFRDALMQRLQKSTFTGYLAAEPAIAFLNGSYWGVYCVYENHDQHWMKNNFGLSSSEVDYLVESGAKIEVKRGSDGSFWDLYNYATVQNPTTQTYYDNINAKLDLKNYTDYFIAETYYSNGDWIGDWTNNIKWWRPNAPGSKWKYMLYDLDMGLGHGGASVNENKLATARNPAAFSYSSEMFDAVLNNPTYKKYFINRYADLINTIYQPTNVNNVMKSFRDTMSYDMTQHFAKWGSNTTTWANNITSLMNFANARPAIVRNQIESVFSLTDQVVLTLATSPAGSGRIEISTITPTSYPWSGTYFNGNPVTITAIPNPGYTFDHFRSNVTITSNNFNQSVTYNFTANDQITAYFTGSSSTPKVCVSELNYNSDSAYNAGDWIELHNYGTTSINLSGWKLSDSKDDHMFVFPTGTVIPANGYLVLTEDSVKFLSQYPTVNNRLGPIGFNFSNGGDQIRLFNHLNTLYLSFYYQDLSPWPTQADGDGYTCELASNTADPNNGSNWYAGCIGGSPGKAYSPLLSIPVTIDGTTTFCAGGSAYLHATYVPGYSYQWKRNNVDISGATDSIYTATLSGSYSVGVTFNGCAIVTPATVITVVTQHPAPQTVSASRCGEGNLVLLASSTDSVFWYDASTGGNLLGIGDTFVTPFLAQTNTYYARTGRTCTSSSVATNAIINEVAASPVASDKTRCGPGSVTLTATDTAIVRWYNAATGGGLLETGSTYVTNILNNDTAFYVEAGSVCPSSRIEVRVTVNTTPSPGTTDNSRCGNGTMDLNAISPDPITWYNSANGGSSLGSGLSFTTPFLTRTDTFYAEANSGCPSVRVRAIAIVIPIPATPVGVNDTLCSPGTATLTATASEQVNWYDAPTGGNLVYLGSVFDTPVLSTTTTFYAESGYQCSSARVPVQVLVGSPPPAPGSGNSSRCGPGSVTLNATSAETIYWYSAATGGTFLGTGSSYNTPSISTTTTYYAEAGTLCRSTTRTPAMAVINNVPAAPVCSSVTRCGNGTVTLTASSPEQIYWYNASSGGSLLHTGSTFVTPVLSSTTTYYVETGNDCRSNRISVQAIIAQSLSAPVATNGSRCGNGTVTISATSTGTISWFSAPSGGSALATGPSYTTPSISSTTTYYAEAFNGCTSSRTPVQAVINTIPSPPVASDGSNCGTGTVTLTATSPQQIYWYTVASGGSPVGTGSTYVTPSLSASTTYYVEAGNNCRSNRISVNASIIPIPSPPVLTGDENCGSGTLVLSASSSGTVSWFNVASGGTSIGSGLSFTTPLITSTTTYYAQTKVSGCSSSRVSVQAVIISIPSTPVPSTSSECGMSSVTLTATSSDEIFWYANSSGGSPLDSGTSYSTPILSSTTTFYLESHDGPCVSNRVSVQAVINTIPSPPIVNDVSRCGSGQVTLVATAPQQIYWYEHQSGGSLLATGSSFTTPNLSSSENYYVETGDDCRSSRERIAALITSPPNPPQVFDTSRCGDGSITIRASSSLQVNWFDVSSGGTRLDTGLFFTTPFLNSSTTYYAEAGIGCNSARVPVEADIIVPPAVPVTADSTRCGSGIVTLQASSPEDIYWYDSPLGGNLLSTNSIFTTPFLSVNTTYYVETGNSCRSQRIPVNAILGGSQVTSVTEGSSCGPGEMTLSAIDPVSSDTLVWYDNIGGNIVGSGTTFTTPFLSSTTTYYIVAKSACTGLPVAVTANVYSLPFVDLGSDTINILSGQQVTLEAGDGFASYQWSTGQTTDEIFVHTGGIYSVTVVDSNGCQASDDVFVNIITSVSEANEIYHLNIYPNPAHDNMTITIPGTSLKSSSLKLFSMDGKVVFREEFKSTNSHFSKTVSLAGIAAGVYIFEMENSDFIVKRKVIVE